MTSELTKAKRKRTTKRNTALKDILPQCEDLLTNYGTEESSGDASALIQVLDEIRVEVKTLDEAVADLMDDEDAMEKHESESYQFGATMRKMQAKLQRFIANKEEMDMKSRMSPRRNIGVKLPKIKIKPFDGEAMEWKPFKDAFDATIHERSDITDIEKFTYLRGFLSGSALKAIEGMTLTNANYEHARDILEKRYGNEQLIVSSHMNALLKLDKIINVNVKDLRELYDKVELNIRALNSVGISSEHFGSLLIPIVLEKLPNNIKLQISRSLGKNNWNIDEFRKSINDEIEARENYEFLKKNEYQDIQEEPKYSAASLAVSSNGKQYIRSCVFCGNKEHYSDKCDVITDIDLRMEKLKERRCCFKCLRADHHIAKNCPKKVFCYRCKTRNKHNTALCKEESASKVQLVAGSDESILLQTANGYIGDEKEERMEKIKILLDSCSQQTFISERVAKKLKLCPIREIKMTIKAFGNNQGKEMRLKEYQVVLKPIDNSSSIYMKAVAMPSICAPISNQEVQLAVKQKEFLSTLKLADDGSEDKREIDMLIGADMYWKVVTGNIKKDSSGLIAISSILGWLVNGPVTGTTEKSVNVVKSVLSI